MPSKPLALRSPVDPLDLRPVVAEFLAIALVLVLVGLATLLPGVDRTAPGIGVPLRAIVVATGTVAVVIGLAHAARSVRSLVESVLDGPEPAVADMGRTAGAVVLFVAVLVAYRGLAGIVVPRLAAGDAAWAYDAGFLLVALVPLAVIARRIVRNLDLLAQLVAVAVADRSAGRDDPADA